MSDFNDESYWFVIDYDHEFLMESDFKDGFQSKGSSNLRVFPVNSMVVLSSLRERKEKKSKGKRILFRKDKRRGGKGGK